MEIIRKRALDRTRSGKYLVHTKNGVWYGVPIADEVGKGYITLKNARKISYWVGVTGLEELAVLGVPKNKEKACLVSIDVEMITLFDIQEAFTVSQTAAESIDRIPVSTYSEKQKRHSDTEDKK